MSKQTHYLRCPALGLLCDSLCGPRMKRFGDPALNQKVSIAVTFTQKCAINYIQLTHKKTLDSHKKTRTLDEMKKH